MTDILCWAFSIFVFLAGMGSERIDLIFTAAFFLLVSAINNMRYKHYSFKMEEPNMTGKRKKETNQSSSNSET